MALKVREIQTQVKHLILSEYMDAWSGIILSGLSLPAQMSKARGTPFRSRLVYVDGFSYKGQYLRDAEQLPSAAVNSGPIWGSPILGIQALDRAKEHARNVLRFDVETAAILVERDGENYSDLKETLRVAGYAGRVVENPPSIAPANGDIVLLRADFLDMYENILNVLRGDYTWSFVLLDPWGFSGIPYEMVRQFVSLPRADVMINWPFLDVQRRSGRHDAATQASLDAMFGTDRWRIVDEEIGGEPSTEEIKMDLESRLARFYEERLEGVDGTVVVKWTQLDFPDRARTIFYLFLTTHDPTGGLTLNKVLDKAELSEFRLRWNRYMDRYVRRMAAVGQPTLFDTAELRETPPTSIRTVNIREFAAAIFQSWEGRTTTRKEVYRSLVNSEVYAGEVDQALTQLKRDGLAEFDSTRINAQIRFAPKGGSP